MLREPISKAPPRWRFIIDDQRANRLRLTIRGTTSNRGESAVELVRPFAVEDAADRAAQGPAVWYSSAATAMKFWWERNQPFARNFSQAGRQPYVMTYEIERARCDAM